MQRLFVGSALVLGSLVMASSAEAHAIPRFYASLGPSTAYDPWQARAYYGGGFTLGLGVDPERDAMFFRAELFDTVGRDGDHAPGSSIAALYRHVLLSDRMLLWTWALGGGTTIVDHGDDITVTVGARGEIGARFSGVVAFTAWVVAGPTAGHDARVPWGMPFGIAIDLGLP
ncbi:hypothetical protein BH09MYX1_BH09MYX1_41170 [soil metagenome]